jgi:amino acid permease
LILIDRYGNLVHEPGHGPATYFNGGFLEFFKQLRLPYWWYVGVECINMAAGDVDEPKKNIPRGQVSCVVTLFFTSMLVLIISAALPPGLYYLQAAATPFNIGTTLP